MSALAYADRTPITAKPAPREAARPGFWRRVLDAIIESRRREVAREVEAYLLRNRRTLPHETRRPDDAWKGPADALPF